MAFVLGSVRETKRIVRKTVVYGTERTNDSTILGIAVIDYNEDDPSVSQQVGTSLTIEIDDDSKNNDEEWFDKLLEDCREIILKSVEENLEEIAVRRFARG